MRCGAAGRERGRGAVWGGKCDKSGRGGGGIAVFLPSVAIRHSAKPYMPSARSAAFGKVFKKYLFHFLPSAGSGVTRQTNLLQ